MANYRIGLDFGTLSGRAVLVDVVTGEELATEARDYPHAVMDTALPDVCGLTVLDELQRRGTAPQRVILLSSIVSEQVTDQAFALGVSHFIPKPFHTDLLFDAMYELFPGCSCGHWPHSPQ